MALAAMFGSCTIQPPLKLADTADVVLEYPEVVTDLEIVWDIDAEWRAQWWYGWDDVDLNLWGPIEYPDPTNFEVRVYYLGHGRADKWVYIDKFTVYGNTFQRKFNFGWHDMVLWSNIDSDDGTQVLIIDESDGGNIRATTSLTRLGYASRAQKVYNNPEIFYASTVKDIYVSDNLEDYDYYDEDRKVWVKKLHSELTPLVYTYLVQCVIYNNNGRIRGLAEDPTISALADGVSVHTGHTSSKDVYVAYPMRMKEDLPARDGRRADIIGGKLTTFGLCDMDSWSKSRASRYSGGRADLNNHLLLDFSFSNSSDSVYTYDITKQLQEQAHGGIITIEIDADTIRIPQTGTHAAAGSFDPVIEHPDSITYDFTM